MKLGFVIDQRKCIGCHACTVACKSENDVPVGNFRTWVKYVEKGTFPSVRRHFSVLRCNHCDEAPCVEICPVTALHKRPDAIVDLNRDVCIGCRACMQACPYDALYLNEQTGTAEKCHYCAHRTEQGLEPACVVVCPEHAIIAGDTENEGSEIATVMHEQETSQRRTEKGTQPRVWYVDALPEALTPGATTEPKSYLWSDRPAAQPVVPAGFEAPEDLLSTLDVAHPPAWGWHIWVYLWTKNLAAGAMLLAPLFSIMGAPQEAGTLVGIVPEIVGLVFLGITGFLLVHDLGRPERFWRILFAPNSRSWLVKGTWFLVGFGILTALSAVFRYFLVDADTSNIIRWINVPFAAMSCGYTAFLFHQCRGRDLWLSRDLFPHLIIMAALMGAGVGMLLSGNALVAPLDREFAILALLNGMWLTLGMKHRMPTQEGRRAHALLYGSRRPRLATWILMVAALLALGAQHVEGMSSVLRWGAMALACAALLIYEKAWIEKGQEVPIS